MGQLRKLDQRQARLSREASERNDDYLASSLAVGLPVLAELASGRSASVRCAAERALASAPARSFHIQHLWATVALTFADLYEGDAPRALERMDQAWPALQRSLLVRVQLLRVEMLGLRAHCTLAAAGAPGLRDPRALIKRAERLTARLGRERMAFCDPWARLLRAVLCGFRGDDAGAAGLAVAAASGFDELDMALHAAAARSWLGRWLGAHAPAEHTRAAARWMASQEVRDPDRLTAVLAPQMR
jgi:hypothetical protein